MKKMEEEVIPAFLKYMNTLLKENGGDFFVGDKVGILLCVLYVQWVKWQVKCVLHGVDVQ